MKRDANKDIELLTKPTTLGVTLELRRALGDWIIRADKAEALLKQENSMAIINGDLAERLQEENAKLKQEQVCHGNKCRLDEIEQLKAENAKLRVALFCQDCKGKGERMQLNDRGYWREEPCPTCSPLRKELRDTNAT